MPINHVPTPDSAPLQRLCPFGWCCEPHVDDWINDEHGDAQRSHSADFPDAAAAAAGFGAWAPYLCVVETRTTRGVVISPAQVLVDQGDLVSIDEFGERLAAVLALIPGWRDVAREVDELRADVAATSAVKTIGQRL